MSRLLSTRTRFAFRRRGRPAPVLGACLPFLAILGLALSASPQRVKNFSTPTPLPPTSTLIVGFGATQNAAGTLPQPPYRLAVRLRALALPGVFVETIESSMFGMAQGFLLAATGRNSKGVCGSDGCREVRFIFYGYGDGAAEMLKAIRKLKSIGLPVALAVEITNAGGCGGVIPSNVVRAANICLDERWADHGRKQIRAEDPATTQILANLRASSEGRWLDISQATQEHPKLRYHDLHTELDPIVWNHVEDYILDELHRAGIPGAPAPPHPVLPPL